MHIIVGEQQGAASEQRGAKGFFHQKSKIRKQKKENKNQKEKDEKDEKDAKILSAIKP